MMEYNKNKETALLSYVCPKCLKYLSIELDGVSTVKTPEETCLNSEDGDFNVIVRPIVRCNECKCKAIEIDNILGLQCCEMISRKYGIEISCMTIGDIYNSVDIIDRKFNECRLYNPPGMGFSNTNDNFVHLVNAIKTVYDMNEYPTVKVKFEDDQVLVYSIGISPSVIEYNDAINRIEELNNNYYKFIIMDVIGELYKLTDEK